MNPRVRLDQVRHTRPATADHLWHWLRAYTGVAVARSPVCRDHRPPFDWVADLWLKRPPQALVLGPRGGGKSFLSALLTHLESRFWPRLGTRILGGSKSQSAQIFEALAAAILDGRGPGGSDRDQVAELLKTEAKYRNGSAVSILAASPTSVRGPHVASLRLDEVDEIDPDLRESALGMCMDLRGVSAQVVMTSTWHRVGGPMAGLIERGRSGAFPVYSFCAFEALERCPDGRSGPYVGGDALYERCPECPLKPWCHSGRDRNGNVPLAKLSAGHYGIGALVQKVQSVSARVFEADYLCRGPKADGVWFPGFSEARHVSDRAEYDPALPVHVSVDSGVFTGAVFFQVRRDPKGRPAVNVFADHLSEGWTAEANGRHLVGRRQSACGKALVRWSTDSAGGARNPIGPTVVAEYERAGMRPLDRWPVRPVADSLAILEALVTPADGVPCLTVHPRCRDLIAALQGYRRARRQGQWQDRPEDPQHPAEDLVDALRGGLALEFPDGIGPVVRPKPRPAGRFLY